MDLPQAIARLCTKQDLDREQMQSVMAVIMRGEATPAQIGAFLVGLAIKGETVEEIVGAVTVMREFALKVDVDPDTIVDTVGTGGDGMKLFNVSTASAFVAAAAGARVAKHGNRGMSGKSGAADLLEQAGVVIGLPPEQVTRCIDEVGIAFMFAPTHHGATRHAVGPRREIGVRNIFNLLGPLTNPAGALRQLIGVYDKRWLRPVAEVLHALGSKHVLVVHSKDGLDEISIAEPTSVVELNKGAIDEYTIAPSDFGLAAQSLETLKIDNAEESLAIVNDVVHGKPGPAADMVALNAGATLYAADRAGSLQEGVSQAQRVLTGGEGAEKMKQLAAFTQQLQSEDG